MLYLEKSCWSRGWISACDPPGCSTKKRQKSARLKVARRATLEANKLPMATNPYPSFPQGNRIERWWVPALLRPHQVGATIYKYHRVRITSCQRSKCIQAHLTMQESGHRRSCNTKLGGAEHLLWIFSYTGGRASETIGTCIVHTDPAQMQSSATKPNS